MHTMHDDDCYVLAVSKVVEVVWMLFIFWKKVSQVDDNDDSW